MGVYRDSSCSLVYRGSEREKLTLTVDMLAKLIHTENEINFQNQERQILLKIEVSVLLV